MVTSEEAMRSAESSRSSASEAYIESMKAWCLAAKREGDAGIYGLACEILESINDHQYPERVKYISLHDIDARCIDLDALLKLADELMDEARSCGRSAGLAAGSSDYETAVPYRSFADYCVELANRIRGALGVEAR